MTKAQYMTSVSQHDI